MVAIVAAGNSGIGSVADLKGKRVGVTFGTTGDLYLQYVLKQAGIAADAVNRVNVAPPNMTSVLDTGGVDAIVTWDPYTYRTLHKVATRLDRTPCSRDPYTYRTLHKVAGSKEVKRGGGLVCLCALLHGSPDNVYKDEAQTQKLVDAIAEGAAYVRNPANKAEVAEIGSRFVDMTKDEAMESLPNWEYDPRIGPNTAAAFKDTVALLIEQKKMKEAYDPAKYIETKFIESTMKRHPEWFADLTGK
jgi:ABC-type nitrate/sulfonate/bicarbonate transport system substrate-binding protein